MSDDWSVGKLDLGAYLRRIGYTGPTEPSEAALAALYRAHLASIRFENFDVFLRGRIDVDLESIQDKIVYRDRGGYCYEQAQLFGAVLERLGFGVDRLLARVGPDGGPARPRTHLTLRVRADQNVWLADVGFGSSPPAPLSLRRFRSGGPQEVDGWIYELTPDEEHGAEVWKLREYQAGEWVTLHRWDDARVQPIDVVLSNHYTSTHPDSWFTWQTVIVKRDQDAIRSILGRTYTVTHAGHAKTRRELTDKEFAEALTGEFALTLTSDELATLVAAPTGKGAGQVSERPGGTVRVVGHEPVFRVTDVELAVEHYRRLGFKTSYHDATYAFASLRNLTVHLACDPAAWPGYQPDCHMTSVLYLHVEDADRLAADWRAAGVTVTGPRDEGYGKREGQHVDPDGNLIRFGSPIP